MDVNGIYSVGTSSTGRQPRQLKSSLQKQRQPQTYEYTRKPEITALEASAITNKALLESLGVRFEKTELDDGFKRIDRVRSGQVVAFLILNSDNKKVQSVEQISEGNIGSITYYRKDGETPFVKLENVTPQENDETYRVEETTIYSEGGLTKKTSKNNYLQVPEYNEFTPEFVDKIMSAA